MYPLDGPRLKADRAVHHWQELDEWIQTWRNTTQFISSGHPNTSNTAYIYNIEILAIPGGVGVVIGDILHNLRSALDHLVWQLALLTTKEPSDKTGFPIFKINKKWVTNEINILLKDVPQNAIDIIVKFQPYSSPSPDTHPLWVLHQLSNCDKHQIITPTGKWLKFDMLAGMIEHWINDYTVEITVPMLNGVIQPPPVINIDCLAIKDKEGNLFRLEVLYAICKYVQDSVIPQFEHFFP